MAILNTQEMFSDNQAITATAASTNVFDRQAPGTWVHASTPLVDEMGNSCVPLFCQVTEDFNSLTSLTIALQADDDSAFGSATTLYTETIALAGLTAGAKLKVRKVPHNSTERYLRMHYTVTGSAPTTGKVTAALSTHSENTWGAR